MSRNLPGTEYFDRVRDFYEDQFQYWKDVTARMNTAAEKIRGEGRYSFKDWLRDGMSVWSNSMAAYQALWEAPLSPPGDQSTPVLSFVVRQGAGSADPKSVRVRPGDEATVSATDLISPAGPPIPASAVVATAPNKGLLEISLQNLAHVAPGQYFGGISNADRSLALIHVCVEARASRPPSPGR